MARRDALRFGFFISDTSGNAAFALRSFRSYERSSTDGPARPIDPMEIGATQISAEQFIDLVKPALTPDLQIFPG
jgi:hypothetical protein